MWIASPRSRRLAALVLVSPAVLACRAAGSSPGTGNIDIAARSPVAGRSSWTVPAGAETMTTPIEVMVTATSSATGLATTLTFSLTPAPQ